MKSEYAMLAVANNDDFKLKYVYHDEFNNTENTEALDLTKLEVHDFQVGDKPLLYHMYNMKKNKHFQSALPFFYKIYNLSAMKMDQMARQIGGVPVAIFTDTIIFENAERIPELSDKIGGMRISKVNKYEIMMNTQPRTNRFNNDRPAKKEMKHIDDFKLEDGKGCFITGLGGTGKSYRCKQLQKLLGDSKFAVCTPTHKSALIVGAVTIYNLFNINPKDNSYLKSAVQKLKDSGVEYIFIDEVSMINSRVWSILNDIKQNFNFKFILIGDFGQLDPVESKIYDVINSEVFAELVDCQKLELTRNYRAEKDPEFGSFIADLIKVRAGETIDFSTYGTKECIKSICFTNKTRKAINEKWNLRESKDKPYITLNNIRVYPGLPVICKKTFTVDDSELKNNEDFQVENLMDEFLVIRSGITGDITYLSNQDFKNFELGYCITVHCSQGSTFDFEYSIYERFMFNKKMLYTAMSRSTEKKNINFVNYYPKVSTGYFYKITNNLNIKL